MTRPAEDNARTLEHEIAWFDELLEERFRVYFEQDGQNEFSPPEPPGLDDDSSGYASLIRKFSMSLTERLVLILALLPEIRPQALDAFLIRNKALDGVYSEFGGYRGKRQNGFFPTLGTAAFVHGGIALDSRFELARLLEADHFFNARGILNIDHGEGGDTLLDARIAVTPETLELVTGGNAHTFRQSSGFPAQLITTHLEWSDLVLAQETRAEVESLNVWIKHSSLILDDWGLGKVLKPGYRTLFHGPPGTGKTLTATLIGATVDADVYRIDLSMVVSKYIGETEKNLARVFDRAERQNWILFFDEADSLFARRTQASSANDRSANREVSYLLQRVEDFSGVVILATNLPANIDEAFARRFQSVIHFPIPGPDLRVHLWRGIVGEKCPLNDDVDLEELARQYEISGGAILNVVRYGAIKAVQNDRPDIRRVDLVEGIRRELAKSGKTLRPGSTNS